MTTLGRAYPALAEKFFANLSQQTGDQVVVSVGAFLVRLAELAKENGASPPKRRPKPNPSSRR